MDGITFPLDSQAKRQIKIGEIESFSSATNL